VRWYWFLAPLLLVSFAGQQIYLAQTHHLSPWSGGGFGMFSSLDAGQRRTIEINVTYDGLRQRQPLPNALRDTAQRTATLPTPENIKKLAEKINQTIGNNLLKNNAEQLYQITLTVWRIRYSPDNLASQPEAVISQTFHMRPPRANNDLNRDLGL
jgi:hypothetical protein